MQSPVNTAMSMAEEAEKRANAASFPVHGENTCRASTSDLAAPRNRLPRKLSIGQFAKAVPERARR